MKCSEFLSSHGPTLLATHHDWLSALADEDMSEVWQNIHDPLCLIEILRCLLNPNYDQVILGYACSSIEKSLFRCINKALLATVKKIVLAFNAFIERSMSRDDFSKCCSEVHSNVAQMLSGRGGQLLPEEKTVLYAGSFGLNCLIRNDELSSVEAAYHITEHLYRGLDLDGQELSDLLRSWTGDPFE